MIRNRPREWVAAPGDQRHVYAGRDRVVNRPRLASGIRPWVSSNVPSISMPINRIIEEAAIG